MGVPAHAGSQGGRSPRRRHDAAAARLVRRLKDGHPDAFDELYRLYLTPVYGYMLVALRDHHEAEDATHEVFVKMLIALPRYEQRSVPFRAWLFRIARNHLLDRMEKLRPVEAGTPAAMQKLLEAPGGEDPAWIGALSDEEFLALIQGLPLGQRQVLVLRYAFDLSFAEIGTALGMSEVAARNLKRRAFARLRPRLEPARTAAAESRASRLAMRMRLRPQPVLRARLGALV